MSIITAPFRFLLGAFAPQQPTLPTEEIEPNQIVESSYGKPIPYGYGWMRQPGTIIWASERDREDIPIRVSRGFLRSSRTVGHRYRYYQSLVVSFGESSEGAELIRLWADSFAYDPPFTGLIAGMRVYSVGGIQPIQALGRLDVARNHQGHFIDPVLTDISGFGIDGMPAYTNQFIIAINRLYLGTYGNRIPKFTAVIRYPGGHPTSIVRSILSRADISDGEAEDIPLEAANQAEIEGFQVLKQQPAKNLMETITRVVDTIPVERAEGQIGFIDREDDETVDVTYRTSDMLPVESQEGSTVVLSHNRTEDHELPRKVEITYVERERDFQSSTASYQRPGGVRPVTLSEGRESLTMPVIMPATSAKRMAERVIVQRWEDREFYDFRLPARAMILEPGDTIQILDDRTGRSYNVRVREVDLGADYTVNVRSVLLERGAFDPVVDELAEYGVIPDPPVVRGVPRSRLYALDIPPTSEVEADAFNNHNIVHLITTPLDRASLDVGAHLFLINEDGPVSNIGATTGGSITGHVVNALADPGSPWRFDDQSFLDVSIDFDEGRNLSSIEYSDLFSTGGVRNLFMLLRADGQVEYAQFQTITPNADGSHRLTGFVRGLFGTEAACYGHATGERFIFPLVEGYEVYSYPNTDIGQELTFEAVQIGGILGQGERAITDPLQGRSRSPWAVAHVGAFRLSNGDITIYWTRRTRFNGGLINNTAFVPINERTTPFAGSSTVFPEYEVDILDSVGHIIHTARGLYGDWEDQDRPSRAPPYSSSGYLFTAADQAAAGFNDTRFISIRVYQVSEDVGRGFALQYNVDMIEPLNTTTTLTEAAESRDVSQQDIPDQLSIPTLASLTSNVVLVTWGGAAGATGFRVRYRPDTGTTWTTVDRQNLRSYAFQGVEGVRYVVQVQGYNIANPGPWSDEAYITV